MDKYVFMSYKSEEDEIARKIKDEFEKRDIKIWRAPESILPGKSYADSICDAISNSSCFLLLLSLKSQDSKWVIRELTRADDENKDIYVLFLDDFKITNNDISLRINNNQTRNYFENKDDVLAELIETLNNKYSFSRSNKNIITDKYFSFGNRENDLEKNKKIIEDIFKKNNYKGSIIKTVESFNYDTYYIDYPVDQKITDILKAIDDLKTTFSNQSVIFNRYNSGTPYGSIQISNDSFSYIEFNELVKPYEFILGIDSDNKFTELNISKMSHILIGGSSGSGKTAFIHQMIASLIVKNPCECLKVGIIDLKMFAFGVFEGLKHLLCPIAKTKKEAEILLQNVISLMDKRYKIFMENGCINLEEYNIKMRSLRNYNMIMPRIIIVVDEIDDLLESSKDFYNNLYMLLTKSRAAGINIILSSQNAKSFNTMIRVNIPTKICFRTLKEEDSRIILGNNNACNLLGRGDMLVLDDKFGYEPKRFQSPFISPNETEYQFSFLKSDETQYVFDFENKNR